MPATPFTADPVSPAAPRRARGVELLGPLLGSGYQQPPLLVRRHDGQTIQLTPLLYRVLEALDGRRNHLEIAWAVAERTEKVLSADEVEFLVEEKLRPLGLVGHHDGTEPVVTRSNPLLALRLRFVVTNTRVTKALTRPFATLFHPVIVALVVAAFASTTGWVLFDRGLGDALRQALYEPRFLLLVFGLTVLSAGFHEIGHAAACRYGGATPGAMGAALYLIWPAFYTDVSDSYRLDRRDRLRVDLGGLYFNAIFAVGTFGVWAVTRDDAWLVMVPIQLFQMVRQLLPLVRFDGYHILADLTGVPDLFARIGPTLRGLLPQHWGDPGTKVLKPWARVVVTTWVLIVIPALGACLVLMVLGLPRVLATAADSLRLQYVVLNENLAAGDVTDVAVRVVSLIAIALPPLSITYLLVRITRRTSLRAWRAGARHPVARGFVTTGFASVVAFLGLALWPGAQYAPLVPGEQVAAADQFGLGASPVFAAAGIEAAPVGEPVRQVVRPPATSVRSGAPTRAPAARPRPTPVASDDAKLAVSPARDLPDRTGEREQLVGARSSWPFPFAPPPAPRAQDNFAVGVNVVDGNRVSVMNSSLLWLDDARVDQRNRSYALASCVDCSTVATAFQVIVAGGDRSAVVPENSAIAINYACTTCVTYSIAIQLVVTTEAAPPASVRRQVTSRFAVAEALARSSQRIPADELRRRLHAVEREILELLAPYTADVDSDATADIDGDADAATEAVAAPTTTTTTSSVPPSTTTTTSQSSTTTTSPSSTTTTPSSTASSTSTSTSTTTTSSPSSTTSSTSTTSTTSPPTKTTTTTTSPSR